MSKKIQTRVDGDVLKIDLGNGLHGYARVLKYAFFAFYEGTFTGICKIVISLICLFCFRSQSWKTQSRIADGPWLDMLLSVKY